MSLIVYPVASDSRAFLPAAFSIALQTNQRAFASPFGGSEQVTDMLNDRWSCTLDLPPSEHNRSAKREAFFEAMRGQTNHTDLYHFGRPTPLGTAQSSAGLVIAAAQGAATLQIATTAGATLLAGDMLGVDGLLLRCAADCTANSNGLLTVPLTNRLRRAVAGLARASTATFVNGAGVVKTAGVNVPRYQGGQLLVEGEATNLILFSEQLNNDAWSKNRASIQANAAIAPDGSLTADKLVEDTTATDSHDVQQIISAIGNTTYTYSLFVKAGTRNLVRLQIGSFGNQVAPNIVIVDLLTGEFTATDLLRTQVVELPNGWYWAATTITTIADPTGLSPSLYLLDDFSNVNYTGNGTGSVFIWGAQIEAGTSKTSYIPTTAAAVTRAADIVRPVTLDRPTAPFRLASTPSVRYVGGYAEGVTLDFVERVS
jgi:hypothetical protein